MDANDKPELFPGQHADPANFRDLERKWPKPSDAELINTARMWAEDGFVFWVFADMYDLMKRQAETIAQLNRYLERYEGGKSGGTIGQLAVASAIQDILDGAKVAWAPSDDKAPKASRGKITNEPDVPIEDRI